MVRTGNRGATNPQKDELWRRRRQGELLTQIFRAIGAFRPSVFRILKAHGGFPPPLCKRSPQALTLAEREEISLGIAAGLSMREIARALQRSPSTTAARLPAVLDRVAIAQPRQIWRPGRVPIDQRFANWLRMLRSCVW